MIPMISVIGFSKTGKTTFVADLVKELQALNYRVGVVKHDPEDHGEVDREHSDTSIFWNAGSPAVVLSSPGRLTIFRRTEEDTNPVAILPLLGDVDCVILEGYKGWSFPKVVIWSPAMRNISIKQGELLAVICNRQESHEARSWAAGAAPVYSRDEIPGIIELLKETGLVK